jgi:hypothetical protein
LDRVELVGCGFVRNKPAVRILASQITPNSICVAAAGRSCILPSSPSIPAIADKLNRGGPVAIEDLFGGDEDRGAIIQLIEFCLRSGALTFEEVPA